MQQFQLPADKISEGWHPRTLLPAEATAPLVRDSNHIRIHNFYPALLKPFLKSRVVTIAIEETDPGIQDWTDKAPKNHARWGYRICNKRLDLPAVFQSGPGQFAHSFQLYDWHGETGILSLVFIAAPRPTRLFSHPVLEFLANGARGGQSRLARHITRFTDRRLVAIHHRVHFEMVYAAVMAS